MEDLLGAFTKKHKLDTSALSALGGNPKEGISVSDTCDFLADVCVTVMMTCLLLFVLMTCICEDCRGGKPKG